MVTCLQYQRHIGISHDLELLTSGSVHAEILSTLVLITQQFPFGAQTDAETVICTNDYYILWHN